MATYKRIIQDKFANNIIPITTANATQYDNTTSGLDATNVQHALDELSGRSLEYTFEALGIPTTGTTIDLMNNIIDENLPLGSIIMGDGLMSDLPENMENAQMTATIVKSGNEYIINTLLTSTEVNPYSWSTSYREGQESVTWRERPTTEMINDSIGKKNQVDMEGTLSGSTITFEPEHVYNLVNNTEYEFDLLFPVSGTLNDGWQMVLNNNGQNIRIINSYNNGDSNSVTVGTMRQLQQYNVETGFRWIFDGTVNVAEDVTTVFITPTVVNLDAINNELVEINNHIDNIESRGVIELSNEEMVDALENGGYSNGKIIICKDDNGFVQGHLYQFIETGDPVIYNWDDISVGLPESDYTILGDQSSATIAGAGKFLYLGSVETLTITATSDVEICILGTLGSISFPETTKTVLIHANGYTGTDLQSSDVVSCKDGSTIGRYNIRFTDLI